MQNHGYHRPLQLIDSAVAVRVGVAGTSPSGDEGDTTDVELSTPQPVMVSKSSSRMRIRLEAMASDDGSALCSSGLENSNVKVGPARAVSKARRSTRQRVAGTWGESGSAWTQDTDEDVSDDEGTLYYVTIKYLAEMSLFQQAWSAPFPTIK